MANEHSVDRDPSHPDINDPWLVAARTIDAESEQIGIEKVMEKHGASLETITFVAEQRALRAVISGTRRGKAVSDMSKAAERGEPVATQTAIELSPQERAMVEMLSAVYVEALFLGYRAAQIKPGDYPEYTGPGSDISITEDRADGP